MAGLLEDALKRFQGRDPIEEEKIARRAQLAQAGQGLGELPEEAGLQEESGPLNVIKPFKDAAIQNSGIDDAFPGSGAAIDMVTPDSPLPFLSSRGSSVMNAANKESRIARMAEKGPPSAAQKMGTGAWQDTVRKGGEELETAIANPLAAKDAYDKNSKAMRSGAQKLKDTKEATAFRSNTAAPAKEPLDYGKIRQSEVDAMRSKEGPGLNYSSPSINGKQPDTGGTSIDLGEYWKTPIDSNKKQVPVASKIKYNGNSGKKFWTPGSTEE